MKLTKDQFTLEQLKVIAQESDKVLESLNFLGGDTREKMEIVNLITDNCVARLGYVSELNQMHEKAVDTVFRGIVDPQP